jgi:peroxiredoxin Q/BCP
MKKVKFLVFILLAFCIIFGFLAFSNMKQTNSIKIGDKIPSFSLQDQNGEVFSIDNFLGTTAMVIYFYPKDDTPGCTKEACSFRDTYSEFRDLNAKVIGISADNVASHKKFAEKYNLPFTLLSDTNNKVRKLFGVPGSLFGLIPGRVTYIVDKNGIVTEIYDNMFNAEGHIEESLKALQK